MLSLKMTNSYDKNQDINQLRLIMDYKESE